METTAAPTLLDWLSAFGSIATPILVLLLTVIVGFYQRRIDKFRELEDKLRGDRISIYNDILEPFILIFSSDQGLPKEPEFKGKTKTEVAQAKMLSLRYKQTAFKLALMGSDEVVRAYNNLMQFFYQFEGQVHDDETSMQVMSLLGTLLLTIRKSVGNETTKLSNLEMLEWLIKDIGRLRKEGKY